MYAHQHVTNNYKYIQYNQTFCSHNQLQILWAVSMLLFWQFLCWVLSDSVSVKSISSTLNLHFGLHGSFLWILKLCSNTTAIITYLMLFNLHSHFLPPFFSIPKCFLWQPSHHTFFHCNSAPLSSAYFHWSISKTIPRGEKLYRNWLQEVFFQNLLKLWICLVYHFHFEYL